MRRTCVFYLRRSTDRQEQSIDDQRAALRRHATAEDLDVVGEYVDDAISGALTAARKEFLRMLEDAKRRPRPFDLILVYDVSRFGRIDNDEAGHYRYELRKVGVEVVYTAEAFRGDRTDEIIRPIKQAIAQQMVVDLSKVTLRGQLSRVAKGRWCGGRPPYGYDLACLDGDGRVVRTVRFFGNGEPEVRGPDGAVIERLRRGVPTPAASGATTLVPGDPTRVAVVRRIFERYVAGGMGLGAVAAALNAEGVPAPFAGAAGAAPPA